MNVLITGAGGFLGNELIRQLLKTTHVVYALSSDKEQIKTRFSNKCHAFSIKEWEDGELPLDKIDVVIHCAFARAHKGGEEIAKSLLFTNKLFNEIVKENVPSLINISTQEVYGSMACPWIESNGQNPMTVYGTIKYYTELLAQSLIDNNQTHITSIRLAGLIGKTTDSRMVNKFVDKAINKEPIQIVGGKLVFSQLDVRDAATGIIALLSVPVEKWRHIYNLGFTKSYSIQEIAAVVQTVGKEFNREVIIKVEKSDLVIQAELDSIALYDDTNWKPRYDMEAMVRSIFEYKTLQK